MKSLLDIQQEIRELEKNMSSLTNDLKSIQSDIENMRNTSPDTGIDYSKIEVLAKQIPFKNHPLGQLQNDSASQSYLEMLLNLVRLDEDRDATINRMAFVQWIQMKSKTNWTLEELYKDSFNITKESYYNFSEAITGKYRDYFMVDALMAANLGGKVNREILEYLAELSGILGINKEELKELSLIAHIALSQKNNINNLKSDIIARISLFDNYMPNGIIKKLLKRERNITVELKEYDAIKFVWYKNDGVLVQEGEIIGSVERSEFERRFDSALSHERDDISYAVSSGRLFQFENLKIYKEEKNIWKAFSNQSNSYEDRNVFGVIANEMDTKENVKNWLLEELRKRA